MSQLSKNSKKINARIQKWREMLKVGLLKDPELLIKRTRKGIPAAMRMKVWPQIINMKKMVDNRNMSYSTVLIKDSFDIHEINLDIPRTFSFQTQQILKKSLFNVLRALSIQFPEVGYCQGMNFLTMRLLQIMGDDTTFYLLYYVIKKNRHIYDDFRNPGFVTKQNYIFKILLETYLPKINKKLDEHHIDPVLYTTSWFLTLYSKSLSDEKFYRFFQCFLVEGYCFVFKTALALLKLKQKHILKNSMEDNLMFVPDMSFYDEMDDGQIIDTANKYEITNAMIKKFEEMYTKKNRQQLEKMDKSAKQNYQKKLKQPRRVFQWSLEDFKKKEVQLIDFDQLQ